MSWDLGSGPIQLSNLHHVGVVVNDARATTRMLSSIWNTGTPEVVEFAPTASELSVGQPFALTLVFMSVGAVTLELVQPSDDGSIWSEFLSQRGEGLHHLAFDVSNYDEMVDLLAAQGHRLLVAGMFAGSRWSYFDTRPGGTVVELRDSYARAG